MIAGAEATMLLTNGGYPFMKLLGVATADEVAAGSAGSRGPWRSAPEVAVVAAGDARDNGACCPRWAVAGGARGQWC